jgi:hypothetical protein
MPKRCNVSHLSLPSVKKTRFEGTPFSRAKFITVSERCLAVTI